MYSIKVKIIIILVFLNIKYSSQKLVEISGPGLDPELIVMPARYFYVNFTFVDDKSYTPDLASKFAVEISGKTRKGNHCRIWVNKLDRKDGSFIVRYKIYETCYDFSINLYYNSKPIKGSPFIYKGPIQADQCNCPHEDFESWLKEYNCVKSYEQIDNDLKYFKEIDMKKKLQRIVEKFNRPESTSYCHYVIKDNKIYRTCYGKHVGFNMFADNILLSLTRKAMFPDVELVINLGDWPLVSKGSELLPVFSWCGSHDTMDIVMPTYDITESTLENMGRVTLDILSVQGGVELPWWQREEKAIWRGRDSRSERLKLVDIARDHPDLFNVSLTNFFFFREKENEYGPKQPHISFFKFFDYKYQVNIDGTVAAYRFPYLLAGGGLVLKQDSPYYEHFYSQLHDWEHFVPVKRDLSDLVDRLQWARSHDKDAYQIANNAKKFATENLSPQHIFCYHALLFWEWSKRIKSEVTIEENMTHVPQPTFDCDCKNIRFKEEL
ncbi:hypothetical protein K1T71_002713 [Dendrolimus kikuchii]|uniref:Uncharacterized protein n=1 Tax=Dendrolimus kikuchii TaxID=765133 RepID=A0ACC1DDR5_9NEOP|nr:hypothetical protein K1T71_002713 [Dendrolimus kikuchii]